MPLAKRSVDEVALPPRRAKVIPETDVLVVGGGPAGIGATLGAARAGAKVLLVEQYGFLGGCATAGLVLTMASYYTSSNSSLTKTADVTLFPIDHGEGRPIIGGVLAELVEKLVSAGGAFAPSAQTGFMVPFDPEVFKQVTLAMLDVAGVEMLFHAVASGVLCNTTGVQGVVFETKSGPVVAKAKVIVDCTGDGDVATFAGAPFEVGRSRDQRVQPMTLMFLLEGVVLEQFNNYVQSHPDQWCGARGLEALMQQAKEQGELYVPRENILLFGGVHKSNVLVNSTRIINAQGTDVWDLTHAELDGQRQIAELTRFFRNYVPGFEKASVRQSGVMTGIRETRRIIGEYQLTAKDVLEARKFKDVIALGSYPVDLHNPIGKGTILKKIKPGQAYNIPLRCLIPKKPENLLVAGRCISGTHIAHASYRTMPVCIATGQAAGICAAIAVKNNQTPRTVNITDVQKELLKQGAYLDI
ncbi:FAD-dependent oxidoreductase [Candidatus Bathycorpusculum sp.]|jgi:ribulose 1,5-bisphosphate synthetase/thiazole synthase|uniref:FAD-dependent oxidoreductase n=1 Tax=Candidatus Bathycorpusculum sp. TaxID=2994959 RepID=UPI00282C713E|nr:FAD-dependent oxidoreductase [Candidatus Termitimicrobium sp.]MCL2431716.1 FAD-dependent oxidoreductase [Candidatus Termitimicrobium sp.]MDR0470573.1 FAD-dependent oxidoreductase [Nitrososphaerota archaeon]